MVEESARTPGEAWDAIQNRIDPLIRARKFDRAISLLRTWLESEMPVGERSIYLAELSRLLGAARRTDEAIAVIHQQIALDPDNSEPWQRLAGHYFYCSKPGGPSQEDLGQALHAIDTAVEKARGSGNWLWYCLGDRCRIALAMKRYDLLEESMRECLEGLSRPDDSLDYGPEGEFLARIPEGTVDSALIERFRAAVAASRARRPRDRSVTGP